MNEVEQRMRRDRAAGLPVAPDLRYTEAAVRRRLGQAPGSPPASGVSELAVALGSLVLMVLLGWGLMRIGLSPWWLGLMPLSLLPMVPILLTKEHEGS